jgi:hypothetical protein
MPKRDQKKLASNVARIASILSEGGQKLMRSFAKGTKGSLHHRYLKEALTALGWQVEFGVGAVQFNDSKLSDYLQNRNRMGHYIMVGQEKKDVFFYQPLLDRDNRAGELLGQRDLDYFMNHPKLSIRRSPSKPTNPELDVLYIQKGVLEVSQVYHQRKMAIVLGHVWLGVPSVSVVSPSGKEGTFLTNTDSNGYLPDLQDFKLTSLWKFLYDQGLQQQAQDFLSDKPTMAVSPAKLRSLVGTGTCAVCLMNVKRKGDRLADHGFKVPRWSYGRTRSCYGTHFAPLEVSPAGAEAYLQGLRDEEKRMEKDLEKLKINDPPIPIKEDRRSKEVLVPGDRLYAYYYDIRVREETRKLEWLRKDIGEVEARVRNWKPTPFPDELMK